jgi:hypothetical protein
MSKLIGLVMLSPGDIIIESPVPRTTSEQVEHFRQEKVHYPPIVRPGGFDGKFFLVEGALRLSIACDAGLTEIPCVIEPENPPVVTYIRVNGGRGRAVYIDGQLVQTSTEPGDGITVDVLRALTTRGLIEGKTRYIDVKLMDEHGQFPVTLPTELRS